MAINETEVNTQLLRKRRITEDKLTNETNKRQKLESQVDNLEKTVEKQRIQILNLKLGNDSIPQRSQKPWSELTRQQQYHRKRKLAKNLENITSLCESSTYKPCNMEVQNIDTGVCEVINFRTGQFKHIDTKEDNSVHSTLYVKDRYAISDHSYHELSMLSDLPSSSKIKKLKSELNSQYDIKKAPGNTIEVQQSLKARMTLCLKNIVDNTKPEDVPSCFRIKLTGDGTQIGRGYSVVNIAFTILEEGTKACSAQGNHSIAIFKVSESNYDALCEAMQDIITEAKEQTNITINGNTYNIEYYLGGDMKFLALVCGIDSATAKYSCIWCKCPSDQRNDMQLVWSITDSEHGARTVEEISRMSTLGKFSKKRFNCSHKPMFDFIPINHVVIDTLHLFL